nr:hypothetical protein [Variovorax sp. OK605]
MNQSELFFPRAAAAAMPMAMPMQVPVSPAVRHMPAPSLASTPAPARAVQRDEPFRFENVEVEARVTYTVRLADYPHPAADAVKVAEQRFRREIDKQLGGDVVAALRAFQNASESSESDLSKAEIAMAKRWAKAYDAARTAGFRDLGDTDEAFFDVRPI